MTNQLWKSAKKVGGTASVHTFNRPPRLWKSAKKVGGTAFRYISCRLPMAVEICQKGGWNSCPERRIFLHLAVEICQKGGWNSHPTEEWSTRSAVEICQKGGWNSLLLLITTRIPLRCGNLPKRWVEQLCSCPCLWFSLLWKSAKKVGGTAVGDFFVDSFFAVEICQKGGWNS